MKEFQGFIEWMQVGRNGDTVIFLALIVSVAIAMIVSAARGE